MKVDECINDCLSYVIRACWVANMTDTRLLLRASVGITFLSSDSSEAADVHPNSSAASVRVQNHYIRRVQIPSCHIRGIKVTVTRLKPRCCNFFLIEHANLYQNLRNQQ